MIYPQEVNRKAHNDKYILFSFFLKGKLIKESCSDGDSEVDNFSGEIKSSWLF